MSKLSLAYDRAVEHIAKDDTSGDADAVDIDVVKTYVTVALIAEVFNETIDRVAGHVVAQRLQNGMRENTLWAVQTRAELDMISTKDKT